MKGRGGYGMKEKERNELLSLYEEMKALRQAVYEEGNGLYAEWKSGISRTAFELSAKNLAYYLALRRRDIRPLQNRLSKWGLSSLGRTESKVLQQLDAIVRNLALMSGAIKQLSDYPKTPEKFPGRKKLATEATALLGDAPKHRTTRIMVTLPEQAATDKDFLVRLLERGMDIARINCAHDDRAVWLKMIENLKEAQKTAGKSCRIYFDIAGPKIRVDAVSSEKEKPRLKVGDLFFLTADASFKDLKHYPAIVFSESLNLFDELKVDSPVILDDGVLEGRVVEQKSQGVVVQVGKTAKAKGIRIKPQKGLNFPESTFRMPILTDKDREDLLVAEIEADILGFSFVRGSKDIVAIQNTLAEQVGSEAALAIPLVIKIETVEAVNHLPELVVAAASKNPLAIMIARGDLAAEAGFLRLSELQEEILWICEAAHIPVIWSTQVLENMVKNGVPTRAEMSDATMAGQAECVMLNKGDFVEEGIALLDAILVQSQQNRSKKTAKLRALKIAKKAWRKTKK